MDPKSSNSNTYKGGTKLDLDRFKKNVDRFKKNEIQK